MLWSVYQKKKFCLWPLRLRWPNRSALPLPPSQNPTQNGKHIIVRMVRDMLVRMARDIPWSLLAMLAVPTMLQAGGQAGRQAGASVGSVGYRWLSNMKI